MMKIVPRIQLFLRMKFSAFWSFVAIVVSNKCENNNQHDDTDIQEENIWESHPRPLPQNFGFSFGLISDLFDELSDFNEHKNF